MPHYPRTSSTSRGYGHRWRKLRKRFLATHPFCCMCEEEGVHDEPATRVDHKVPHQGDPTLMWDEDNLQPLCRRHHDLDKQRMEHGGQPRREPHDDGWPRTTR